MSAAKHSRAPNFKVISRQEIIVGMRQAKNPKTQKKIYADLCCCTVHDIEKLLKEDEDMARWTEDEINELKNYVAEGKSNLEMAKHFGRDSGAVAQKICELRKKGEIPAVRQNQPIVIAPTGVPESDFQNDVVSTPPGNVLQYYKERCEIAEAALEAKIRELAIERQANAELRILAKMIGKVADL